MFWLSDVFTATDTAKNMRLYEIRARAARTRILRRAFSATAGAVLRIGASVGGRIASRRRAPDRTMDRVDEHMLMDIDEFGC